MGEVTRQSDHRAGVMVRQSSLEADPVGLGSSAVAPSSASLEEAWAGLRKPPKEGLQQLRQREQ